MSIEDDFVDPAISRCEKHGTESRSYCAKCKEEDVHVEVDLIARLFHETYEDLAPTHNYKTRTASRVPWADVPHNNKELMRSTVFCVLAILRDKWDVDPLDIIDSLECFDAEA